MKDIIIQRLLDERGMVLQTINEMNFESAKFVGNDLIEEFNRTNELIQTWIESMKFEQALDHLERDLKKKIEVDFVSQQGKYYKIIHLIQIGT